MPARRADDPLVLLPLRVPASLRAVLVEQANAAGSTLSDALRSHLTLAAAKPLGKPVPRRRQPQRLAAVSGADPELVRQVAAIGSNLNQIARAANTVAINGKQIEIIELLVLLRSIERKIDGLPDVWKMARRLSGAH